MPSEDENAEEAVLAPASTQKFGRKRAHAPPKGRSSGAGEEARNAIMATGWCRRTIDVMELAQTDYTDTKCHQI